ncbi:MAG: lipoyl synthase [Actinomycetota bacterium]|nr:lipoyl synthase [Actinomycetota bacterium]
MSERGPSGPAAGRERTTSERGPSGPAAGRERTTSEWGPSGPAAGRERTTVERLLRVRWLGRVPYRDAHALQQGLFRQGRGDHLLLLEHPHVYTLGVRADLGNVLVPAASVGAELVRTDRGGDVTYHGPGQLVGYPVLDVPGKRGGGMADTAAYVHGVEQLVIDVLGDLGLPGAGALRGFPGVWIDAGGLVPRKICAIGVRLSRGRSMHGFALNVDPDLSMFDHIVPCGIPDKAVTSLAAEGIEVTMADVVDAVAARAAQRWGAGRLERQDTPWRPSDDDLSAFSRGLGPGEVVVQTAGGSSCGPGAPADARTEPTAPGRATPVRLGRRLEQAGVTEGLAIATRKPSWLRAPVQLGPGYLRLKRTMRDLDLVTVCEEAGCPNLSECWADGTATFMINGERCTRACGFCLVDTRHPEALAPDEPERVAEAVARMGLGHAVVTAVARDDLPDGGAGAFGATIGAIRRRTPGCAVEVLISDCKGDPASLQLVFDARPDVVNHNLETVLRLQRAVRPSASYARSLAVLARSRAAGLTTKSGLIVGMGETDEEVEGALADLAGVGVDIVTIGQYLRPTTNHLPVARWVEPAAFARFAEVGQALGIGHVESSPLTRSSYHARQAVAALAPEVGASSA